MSKPGRRLYEHAERELSLGAAALVRSLYERRGFWQRCGRRSTSVAEVLQEISETHECRAIPFVLPFVFSDDRLVADVAARAVGELLQTSSSRVFLNCVTPAHSMIDATGMNSSFQKLSLDGLDRFETFGEMSVYLLGLASLHWNGHVREEAVKRLGAIRDGRELPFLLVRMNDWTSSISLAARRAVESRLVSDYAGHFVRNLGILVVLNRSRRADYRRLTERVLDLLNTPDVRSVVVSGM